MRLIDADALLEKMKKTDRYFNIVFDIEAAPTINVVKSTMTMTLKQNITSILECYFSGFKDELIESCVQRIMEQIERQADIPQAEREGE